MFKKGDKVTVLDDAIDGIVISVIGNEVLVETTEGFELSFAPKELIKIAQEKLNFGISGTQFETIMKQKEIPKPRSFVKDRAAGWGAGRNCVQHGRVGLHGQPQRRQRTSGQPTGDQRIVSGCPWRYGGRAGGRHHEGHQ